MYKEKGGEEGSEASDSNNFLRNEKIVKLNLCFEGIVNFPAWIDFQGVQSSKIRSENRAKIIQSSSRRCGSIGHRDQKLMENTNLWGENRHELWNAFLIEVDRITSTFSFYHSWMKFIHELFSSSPSLQRNTNRNVLVFLLSRHVFTSREF